MAKVKVVKQAERKFRITVTEKEAEALITILGWEKGPVLDSLYYALQRHDVADWAKPTGIDDGGFTFKER